MKKSLFFIAMLLVSFTMAAQDKGNREEMKEKFFQAKVKEMVYRLDITDEQKPEFVKVYKAYTEDMRNAFGEGMPNRPMPPKGGMKKGEKPQGNPGEAKPERKQLTMEEVVKIEKDKVARQQRVQAVKLKYIDEFAKVLDAKQLSRFFAVEAQMQNKLRAKQQGAHHGKGMRPGNGPRPQGPRPGNGPRGPRPADEPKQTAE